MNTQYACLCGNETTPFARCENCEQDLDEAEEHRKDLEHESRVDYASWETDNE